LIEIKKIDGVRYIKWIGTKPTQEMAYDLCVKINNQKNHKNETLIPGESGNLHVKELELNSTTPKEELTDSQKIDLIFEKVIRMEAILAELCGETVKEFPLGF
jgi:hypothetical protein